MATSHLDRAKQAQSKRSNMMASNSRTDFNNSNDQSDYEIVIQFELRREREKTRILEERLHNKEVFIQQMKEYQDQLTLAFEKCQEELIAAKKLLEKHYLAEKNYEQEVTQLKHLVIRLEDQINLRQKDKRHYSSVKQDQPSPFKKREVRSKTLMNNQEDSPKGKINQLEQQVIKQSKKIAKFIKQFLMMTSCFCSGSSKDSLKTQLKTAWKWIKDVVKEWNDLRNEQESWNTFLSSANQKKKLSKTNEKQEIISKILTIIKSH